MKRIFRKLIVLATLSLLTGCATTPIGERTIHNGDVWRMEVRNDELKFRSASLMEGHRFNWTDKAKSDYRWVLPAMVMGEGWGGSLVAISAAVIVDGVPLLEKGDVIDVYFDLSMWNYDIGKAPTVLRRVCSIHDEACLAELRKTHKGKLSGINVTEAYPLAKYMTKLSAPLKDHSCALLVFGCKGELPTSSDRDNEAVK